jgi:hypothetical protein
MDECGIPLSMGIRLGPLDLTAAIERRRNSGRGAPFVSRVKIEWDIATHFPQHGNVGARDRQPASHGLDQR